ncbi:MAG: AraC family transcriptional regulator [Pyrinomonadaceae bacterium]
MKNKPSEAKVEFEDGGSIARRRSGFLADGTFFFEDKIEIKGLLAATYITGPVWLLEFFELEKGEFYFESGTEKIRARAEMFGILYSPFSILRPCCRNVRGRLKGFASSIRLPEKFLSAPYLFDSAPPEADADAKRIIEVLKTGRNHRRIEINPAPSLLSIKAKRLIDENYLSFPSIGRIADRVGVSHEHLTRRFKLDFGLSPNAYLHKLRASDANFRLIRGEEIIDVSMDVGYNDLSRFYKQFRKNMKASPGICRKKKNGS